MAYRSKVRRMAKRHLSRRSQKSYVNWGDFNRFTDLHPLASPKRLIDLIAMNRQLHKCERQVGSGSRMRYVAPSIMWRSTGKDLGSSFCVALGTT